MYSTVAYWSIASVLRTGFLAVHAFYVHNYCMETTLIRQSSAKIAF